MTYQRKPVAVPRLAGLSLRAVSWLARSSLGAPIRRKMLRDSGVLALDELGLLDAPAYRPPVDVDATDHAETTAGAPNIDLETLLLPSEAGDDRETIARFVAEYRSRETTPYDVAERVIEATRDSEARTPAMRVFIAQDVDDVLKQAKESTERLRTGNARGPLEGVPIAVKDEVDQLPYPTTVGKSFGSVPKADATVVERLRAAGALLIGKTNMHEIGIGVTGLNVHHGTPRNPYDPERHTGGSSSGSAAAVAMGLCPAAIGADGGGSIRIPASFCGLVGLKPTFGRVSEHGAAPLCPSLAHLGPLGLSVADVALVYAAIAGADERDPLTSSRPVPSLDARWADLSGVRIGVFRAWFDDAEEAVVRSCRRGLEALRERGAKLVDVEVPELELARLAHLVTIGSEMFETQRAYFDEHWDDYGADTRLLFTLVSSFPPGLYFSAQRARARVGSALRSVFSHVDALATPSAGCVAPKVPLDALTSGESNLELFDAIMRFAPLANLLGLPGLSVPVGHVEGLPVGLQLMAAPWQEHALLQLGAAVEAGAKAPLPRVHYRMLK